MSSRNPAAIIADIDGRDAKVAMDRLQVVDLESQNILRLFLRELKQLNMHMSDMTEISDNEHEEG